MISIIIPAYNSRATIVEALESVLAQSLWARELLSCPVDELLSESPASPGELLGCPVDKLLSESPAGSQPSATQQPNNLTTSRASGSLPSATQQPNNLTTSLAPFGGYEVIIVDDCSTDNTVEVVQKWIKDRNHSREGDEEFSNMDVQDKQDGGGIPVSSELSCKSCSSMLNPPLSLHDSCGVWSVVPLSANRGPAGARNAGIAAATGEWIAFLDADDAWLPDKMELQMAFLDAHPESVMICGDYIDFADNVTTEDGREAGLRRVPDIKHVHIITLEELACQNPVATSTVVVKKAVLEAVGGFDEQFRGPEDYDLWIRIAALTGSRLISCQGVKLLSESPEVSPSTTTQQPNNLTTAASGTANIMHIALPVSLYRQQTGSLSMDDRKFLPQVLRVVDKAWGKGGALHGMGGQRQARGYHHLACAWMAAERGALGWAVRLWLLAVWYWPFPVRGWRRHIPWAHAKVAWRILSQLKRRFFMGNGPVLKGAVQ